LVPSCNAFQPSFCARITTNADSSNLPAWIHAAAILAKKFAANHRAKQDCHHFNAKITTISIGVLVRMPFNYLSGQTVKAGMRHANHTEARTICK
jgi:hypothetical protein